MYILITIEIIFIHETLVTVTTLNENKTENIYIEIAKRTKCSVTISLNEKHGKG
jgi:hypothetical protein